MQGNKLYVGNLTYSVTNDQLTELLNGHGEVRHVNIIEGKGFGFVEMADDQQAEKAREGLNGSVFEGRTLKVAEARPPKARPGGGDGYRDR